MIDYSDGIMPENPRILLTFVGLRDPHPDGTEDNGPVLSLLEAMPFDQVVLFCTGSAFLERARSVQEIMEQRNGAVRFSFVNLELESVVDYEEIYLALQRSTRVLLDGFSHHVPRLSILLDPGTPQMQTSWFLLVRSGQLDAALLQGIPPRFAGGVYKVKTIQLDDTIIPEVRMPGSHAVGLETGERLASYGNHPEKPPWINARGPEIVGNAPCFTDLLESAVHIARYDVSVLIRGETGSGKGLVARLIHQTGGRSNGPFLSLNCSAVTASLAESELFGHIKGAFTGAIADRLGQFRAAAGGTIFLDEIGDLPLELQPKLLRVLEEKVVVPVGAEKAETVDLRVIAATNRDLEAMIERNEFRRDLYERLNQTTLMIPPLRERSEDIPLLIRKFLLNWNTRYHESKTITPEAASLLCVYPWPGNVRELENGVIYMCASSRSDTTGTQHLPPAVAAFLSARDDAGGNAGTTGTSETDGYPDPPESPAGGTFHRQDPGQRDISIPEDGLNVRALLHSMERAYYEKALARTGGNAEKAAALLGISGHALRKAMRERFSTDGNADFPSRDE
jgi:DNA-binding NtrC family response regulator